MRLASTVDDTDGGWTVSIPVSHCVMTDLLGNLSDGDGTVVEGYRPLGWNSLPQLRQRARKFSTATRAFVQPHDHFFNFESPTWRGGGAASLSMGGTWTP